MYQADCVRSEMDEARDQGVRFKVVGFVPVKYREWMTSFTHSLGLTREEVQVTYHAESEPDELTVSNSFGSLSWC
jgi:hypothetical protein